MNENLITESLENFKSQGWVIEPNIWFKFRDGRTPPKISPWGCVLAVNNLNAGGNFIIPGGNWYCLVRDYLETTGECLDRFIDGFNGVPLSSMWMNSLDAIALRAYQFGKELSKNYL